tara:strand:- start:210 stop:419 length:210 start_codon:yes stop_codon:yes gene_type:complete
MSKPLDLQDGTGIVVEAPNVGILIAHGTSVPGGVSGYAKGCLFIDTAGAAVYVNEGDDSTADFDAITTA